MAKLEDVLDTIPFRPDTLNPTPSSEWLQYIKNPYIIQGAWEFTYTRKVAIALVTGQISALINSDKGNCHVIFTNEDSLTSSDYQGIVHFSSFKDWIVGGR